MKKIKLDITGRDGTALREALSRAKGVTALSYDKRNQSLEEMCIRDRLHIQLC